MNLSRRNVLAFAGSGIVAISILPIGSAFALSSDAQGFVDEFTSGTTIDAGGIEITAPELAENGGAVPITIKAEGAQSLMLIAEKNPYPKILTVNFGELSGNSEISTKIRMAESQDLYVVAKMPDGSFISGAVAIEVTVGGC